MHPKPNSLLVANLTEEGRAYVESIAAAGRAVVVPLVQPPADDSVHELEVRTSSGPPLRLLAKLAGAPTAAGVPLHLQLPPAPADSDPLVGRRLANGKLVIESLVGVGGAGSVYRARHRDLQMPVAVKVMHESYQRDAAFCAKFESEALSASRLDHANLTRVLDFGQEPDGLLYIAMEFLDGVSLRDRLEVEKHLPVPLVVNLMIQICSGLLHAHARGIVHRDIKPENLVVVTGLDDNGQRTEIVKVCDFGIASRGEGDGTIAGTAEYMAPELFRGEPPDVQSDVYACGVVAYELLTGAMPIPGDMQEVMQKIQVVEPDPPSRHVAGIDGRIDRIVMKAIAKNKRVRYASVRDLRDALRDAMEQISLFTPGGYWGGEVAGAPVATTTTIAMAEPSSDPSDWLERGPSSYASMTPATSSPPSGVAIAVAVGRDVELAPQGDAMRESQQTAEFLQRIMQTKDASAFAAIVAQLEPRVRSMMAERDADKLWRLWSTLDVVANEGSPRSAPAQELLRTMRNRDLLGPLAERALDGRADRDGGARKLLVRAGKNGAYALYAARLKDASFETRDRFVSILHDCGAAALPMLRAGLERLESKVSQPNVEALAEDLLKALPRAADDATADLVARYAAMPTPSLARVATAALPRLAGVRARPLLLSLVEHRDDAMAIAAIRGLAELDQIDAEVIRQLEPIALGELTSRTAPRVAAIEALGKASREAIVPVQQLLVRILHTNTATPEAEDLVACAASSFLAVGGSKALVHDRAQKSAGLLRKRLDALLQG